MATRSVKRKLDDELSEADKELRIPPAELNRGIPASLDLLKEAKTFVLEEAAEKKMDPVLYGSIKDFNQQNFVIFLNCLIPRVREDLLIFKGKVYQSDADKIFLHYVKLMNSRFFVKDYTEVNSEVNDSTASSEFERYCKNLNDCIFHFLNKNVKSCEFHTHPIVCMYYNQFVNQLICIWYGGNVHAVTWDKENKMVWERSSDIVLHTFDSIVNRGKEIIDKAKEEAKEIIAEAHMEAQRIMREASSSPFCDGYTQEVDIDYGTQEETLSSQTDDHKESEEKDAFKSDDEGIGSTRMSTESILKSMVGKMPDLKLDPETIVVLSSDSESESKKSKPESKPESKPKSKPESKKCKKSDSEPESILDMQILEVEKKCNETFRKVLQIYPDVTLPDITKFPTTLYSDAKKVRYIETVQSVIRFVNFEDGRMYVINPTAFCAMKNGNCDVFFNYDNPMYINGVGHNPNMYGNFFFCRDFFLCLKDTEHYFYVDILSCMREWFQDHLDEVDNTELIRINAKDPLQTIEFAMYFKDGNLLMKFILDILDYVVKIPRKIPSDGNILNSFTYEWNYFIELLCNCRFNPSNHFVNKKNIKMILKMTLERNHEFFDWEALDDNAKSSIRGIIEEIANLAHFSTKDIECYHVTKIEGETLSHIQKGDLLYNMMMITLGRHRKTENLNNFELRQAFYEDEYGFKCLMSAFLYALPYFDIMDEDVDFLLDHMVDIFMHMTILERRRY